MVSTGGWKLFWHAGGPCPDSKRKNK